MSWILSHLPTSLCYGFLYLTVLLLWYPRHYRIPVWMISLLFAIGFGLLSGILSPIALVPIIILALSSYYCQSSDTPKYIRYLLGVMTLILSVCLTLHIVPGFHNLQVLHKYLITKDAIPFTLYLNFDEAIVGIFIIGLGHTLITKLSDWLLLFKKVIPITLLVFLMVMLLPLICHFIKFEPKLPQIFYIWAPTNLLFTCVEEEALFRGFIQKYLVKRLGRLRGGEYWGILIASILFGLRHYSGGPGYIVFAGIAGLGYGYAYAKTKRIEGSIIVHFLLNTGHILLFTYPALAVGIK